MKNLFFFTKLLDIQICLLIRGSCNNAYMVKIIRNRSSSQTATRVLFRKTESEWNLICNNSSEAAKINLNTRYLPQLKVSCRQWEIKGICIRVCVNKLLEIRGDGITSTYKTELQPEVAKAAKNHSNITEEPKLQEQSKPEGYITEKQGERKGRDTGGDGFQGISRAVRAGGQGGWRGSLQPFTVFWMRQLI